MTLSSRVLVFTVVAWGAGVASATDGVIEINQAKALAGDVTPGDLPGFPVVIETPGSYRLTSDLHVDFAINAIGIDSASVTIDLNGFGIYGPCNTFQPTCAAGGTGIGIDAPLGLVTVRNGFLSGTNDDYLRLGGASHVIDVTVWGCGVDGIETGDGGSVESSLASSNQGVGLHLGLRTSFRGNESRGNGSGSRTGGVATGGNVCDDGRCTTDGRRRYFLSTASVPGNQALTACSTGFHLASFAELHADTTLAYDDPSAHRNGLDGIGPPTLLYGWVRTGAPSDVGTGNGNCALWTSIDPQHFGRIVRWSPPATGAPIAPWIPQASSCNTPNFVWCVED